MKERAKIFQIKDVSGKRLCRHNKAECQAVKVNMSRWFCILLISAVPCFGYSQYGLNIKTFFGQSETLDDVNISQDGLQASIEYNFRLKQKRIEFRPGLGYRVTWNSSNYDGYFISYDFDFNTAIYPFDFGGDCHCPTFSKSGDLFKKGFFLEFNPGVGYQFLNRLRTNPDDPSKLPIKSNNMVWKIGGSAGLDIGLSDQYTLTPLLSYTLLTSSEWEGLNTDGSTGQLDDQVYLGVGVRITRHQDDKRRR